MNPVKELQTSLARDLAALEQANSLVSKEELFEIEKTYNTVYNILNEISNKKD